MSERAWDQLNTVLAALLAIVLVAITVYGVWGVAALQTENRIREDRYSRQYAASAQESIERACAGLELPALTKCIREIVDATRENQRSEHDLSAQQEMARWALLVTVATFGSVLVTGIGVMFVKWTLDATRDMAIQARESNKSAAMAAKAAENAVAVTSDTAKRQLRAYVFPDAITFANFDGDLSFHVKIKNSGQTPAYRARIWTQVKGALFPLDQELLRMETVAKSVNNLPPGGTTWCNVFLKPPQAPLPEHTKQILRDGRGAIYVFGEITYVDAFGKKRWTRFRSMCGGPSGVHADGSLTVCEEGNEADEPDEAPTG